MKLIVVSLAADKNSSHHCISKFLGDNERHHIWLNLSHEMDANYVTKYDQTFGKCFSIEINPNVTKMGVTKIEFYAKLNIYIYLHHPGQYMDVDSKSKVSNLS